MSAAQEIDLDSLPVVTECVCAEKWSEFLELLESELAKCLAGLDRIPSLVSLIESYARHLKAGELYLGGCVNHKSESVEHQIPAEFTWAREPKVSSLIYRLRNLRPREAKEGKREKKALKQKRALPSEKEAGEIKAGAGKNEAAS